MSRHRNMRNIASEAIDEVYYDDYDEDDDYYDDDYDDDYGYGDDSGFKVAPIHTAKPAKKTTPKPQQQQNNQQKSQAKPNANNQGNAKKNNKKNSKSTTNQQDSLQAKENAANELQQENMKLLKEYASPSFLQYKSEQLKKDLHDRGNVLRSHMLMLGHVDSGKSSLLGRLLLEQGRVQSRTLTTLEKQSADAGKGSFALAWLCDEETSERERGITVDVASQWFLTPNRVVYVWDCPGHRDFVSNMLTAANHAKSCVLLVSARPGEFESGFEGGQTREHAILAYGAGVRNVIVAVNKMDSINYSQERYDFIVSKITEMLTSIGFSKPQFVPVSAKDNVNISPSGTKAVSKALGKASTTPGAGELEPSVAALLPWFKGPSLVDLIDKLPPDVVDVTTPFTMAIHEVFVNPVFGLTIAGKVLTGACVVKERIALYPSGFVSTVRAIQERDEVTQSCFAGDVVSINIKLHESDDQTVAFMSSVATDTQKPTTFGVKFTADIYTDMTLGSTPIVPGAQLILYTQHISTPATITKIISVLGTKSKRFIPNYSHARVEVSTELPIPILYSITKEEFAALSDEEKAKAFQHQEYDRICLRRDDETVATGNVLLVDEEKRLTLVIK